MWATFLKAKSENMEWSTLHEWLCTIRYSLDQNFVTIGVCCSRTENSTLMPLNELWKRKKKSGGHTVCVFYLQNSPHNKYLWWKFMQCIYSSTKYCTPTNVSCDLLRGADSYRLRATALSNFLQYFYFWYFLNMLMQILIYAVSTLTKDLKASAIAINTMLSFLFVVF